MLKELPIGISTLEEIVGNDCVYVDKTEFVAKLITQKYYFLSRPRRFGKTLFLDTLKQAFLGNKELFKGLYLENNWETVVLTSKGGLKKVIPTNQILRYLFAKLSILVGIPPTIWTVFLPKRESKTRYSGNLS